MLGDTTEMKLDDGWRDPIPPDELAVQPPMMPEQPFNMNGNMQFGNSMLRQQNNPYNPYQNPGMYCNNYASNQGYNQNYNDVGGTFYNPSGYVSQPRMTPYWTPGQTNWMEGNTGTRYPVMSTDCSTRFQPQLQYIRRGGFTVDWIVNDVQNNYKRCTNPFGNDPYADVQYDEFGIVKSYVSKPGFNPGVKHDRLYGIDYKERQNEILSRMVQEAENEFYQVCDKNLFCFVGVIPAPIYNKYKPELLMLEQEAEDNCTNFWKKICSDIWGTSETETDAIFEDEVIEVEKRTRERIKASMEFVRQDYLDRKRVHDQGFRERMEMNNRLLRIQSYRNQFCRPGMSAEEWMTGEVMALRAMEVDALNFHVQQQGYFDDSFRRDPDVIDAARDHMFQFKVNEMRNDIDRETFNWLYDNLHACKDYDEFVRTTGITNTQEIPNDYVMPMGMHTMYRLEHEYGNDVVRAFYEYREKTKNPPKRRYVLDDEDLF